MAGKVDCLLFTLVNIMKIIFLSILIFLFVKTGNAATSASSDSARVIKELEEFIGFCKKIDGEHTEHNDKYFKKAAAYVIYRGGDVKRKWKDFIDVKNKREMTEVESICFRMRNSVAKDPSYKITGYKTDEESEGVWHIVYVDYTQDGVAKKAIFAFLKINNRFGIGDID
jgi:hypothetical protein